MIFEAIMLLCFGAAWPVSIYKAYKSRTAKGVSMMFMYILLIGYAFGILNKIMTEVDYVLALYLLNTIMVSINIVLVLRNKAIDAATSDIPE